MTTMDKAAIWWSIAIVAIGVAVAFAGQSGQNLGVDIQSPEAIVRPGTIEEPSYEETKPQSDPFEDLAAEVREQSEEIRSDTMSEPVKDQAQDKEQMREQEQDKDQAQDKEQMREQEQKQMGPTTVPVSIPQGTAVPGCEETNECYIPYEVTISIDDTVSWTNDDTAAHTVTSGSPSDGPDGKFDSSLILGGAVYEFTFEQEGTYDYFCMVHPWMEGIVQVN